MFIKAASDANNESQYFPPWGHREPHCGSTFISLFPEDTLLTKTWPIIACRLNNGGKSSESFIFPHFILYDGNHYGIIRVGRLDAEVGEA